MGTIDRISDLPDFILHTILSILDPQEAGRASVLSKRWYLVWSSIPVLCFRDGYFRSIDCCVGFIDKTMERYCMHKYRITKINLLFYIHDEKQKLLLDKWIMIAVQNQIQKLIIMIINDHDGIQQYMLPEILFSAKSLKYLTCFGVGLPYYETMELISLEHLESYAESVDRDMLQRIISFCPLVELHIGIKFREGISVPWTRKINLGAHSRGRRTMQSDFQESLLQKLVYYSNVRNILWPWNINMVALKNLRKLEIHCAPITDVTVSELVYGLVALESLVLDSCSMLKCIKISSVLLKELRIVEVVGLNHLMKVTVNAPNLLNFFCNCKLETSVSLVRALDPFNAQFIPFVTETITIGWLVKLKEFLIETKSFTSLALDLTSSLPIEVEEEQLRNMVTGPSYKLKELKLLNTDGWDLTESSLVAFLDGLFWCCHPDVLSISTTVHNSAAKLIFDILGKKARCWKDPLKSFEVEDVEFPQLVSNSFELKMRVRLSW